MDGQMEGWTDERIHGQKDGWVDGWTNGWINGPMDEWMDGWTHGWMDGRAGELRRQGSAPMAPLQAHDVPLTSEGAYEQAELQENQVSGHGGRSLLAERKAVRGQKPWRLLSAPVRLTLDEVASSGNSATSLTASRLCERLIRVRSSTCSFSHTNARALPGALGAREWTGATFLGKCH